MPFRNKYGIDLFNNPLKKIPELLEAKNKLEATWYDREAGLLNGQLDHLPGLMPVDRDFENWFAEFYDNSSKARSFDRDFVFFDLFGNVAGRTILELGSGNGCLTRFLSRRGAATYSIDVSLNYCRFLTRSDSASSPIRACAEILPLRESSFDIVTSFVALHHFNLDMCLGEICRVLKPGGRGIFMEPLANSRFFYILRQLVPIKDNESPGGGGLRRSELLALLAKHHFSISIREFELLTRLERLPPLLRFQRRLRRLDYLLLSAFPRLKRLARILVVEIRKEQDP
jgi:SAM-dependent methyltransferase